MNTPRINICCWCGVPFEVKRRGRYPHPRTCSTPCAQKMYQWKQPEKPRHLCPLPPQACAFCQQPFSPRRKATLYCSRRCIREAHAARHPGFKAQHAREMRERAKARDLQGYLEKVRAQARASYYRNREKRLAQMARYRAEHAETFAASVKDYKERNREEIRRKGRERRRQFAKDHPEKVREWKRNDELKHPERVRKNGRDWARRQAVVKQHLALLNDLTTVQEKLNEQPSTPTP